MNEVFDPSTANFDIFSLSTTLIPEDIDPIPGGKRPGSKGPKFTNNIEIKRALAIISTSLITLLIITLFVSSFSAKCRQRLSTQKQSKMGKFFFITFVCALSLFYIECWLSLFMTYYVQTLLEELPRSQFVIFLISSRMPHSFGTIVFEMHFIGRLYLIYNKCGNMVNKWLIFLCLLSILSFICRTIEIFSGPLHVFQHILIEHNINVMQNLRLLSTILGNFIGIIVIYLFVKILYTMNVKALSTTKMESLSGSDSPSKDGANDLDIKIEMTQMKRTQKHFIRLITRYSLLAFIGLTSTFVTYTYYTLDIFFDFDEVQEDPFLFRCIVTIDVAVNVWTMYLVFTWSANVYHHLCCCCDKWITICCLWFTEHSVERSVKKQVTTEMMVVNKVPSASPSIEQQMDGMKKTPSTS